MKATLSAVLFALLLGMIGCGGSSSLKTQPTPRNVQGNWIFFFEDQDGITWHFGGKLFESNPPTVTTDPLVSVGDCHQGLGGSDGVVLSSPAQVVGINSITFNFASQPGATQPASYTLIGTIAEDEQHMSGTYTGSSPCGRPDPAGPWRARRLPPVTGNWVGDNVTASFTEDPPTSPTMGRITGTMTVAFARDRCIEAGQFTIEPTSSGHDGEILWLSLGRMTAWFTTDENTTVATGSFLFFGDYLDPCNNQGFSSTMYHQP